ncbi:MAG: TVP38/TMEM64 family protein, partial [Gemmobacter sp.]
MTRLALFLALALATGAALWALRGTPLDLDALRGHVARLEAWRAGQPVVAALIAFAAYVAVTALSLPVAIWMTLAIGALFGFWTGLLIVSFAASIGATLAFLAARYLARDWVAARLGA